MSLASSIVEAGGSSCSLTSFGSGESSENNQRSFLSSAEERNVTLQRLAASWKQAVFQKYAKIITSMQLYEKITLIAPNIAFLYVPLSWSG